MSREVRILNDPSKFDEEDLNKTKIDLIQLSKILYQKILKLKGENTRKSYAEIRETDEFKKFQKDSCQLSYQSLESLKEDSQRKLLFINLYNVLTIHAIVLLIENEEKVTEFPEFWSRNAYNIGGLIFTLDHMEHGVLRCNKVHPTTGVNYFPPGDPRKEFILPELDPRIHFVLNCGAKSCPPVRLFTDENLDKMLELATKSFFEFELEVNADKKTVTLSKILDWYGADFGGTKKEILMWIMSYVDDEKKNQLSHLVESSDDDEPIFEFREYDWSIH